jgi:hypothetical protein
MTQHLSGNILGVKKRERWNGPWISLYRSFSMEKGNGYGWWGMIAPHLSIK